VLWVDLETHIFHPERKPDEWFKDAHVLLPFSKTHIDQPIVVVGPDTGRQDMLDVSTAIMYFANAPVSLELLDRAYGNWMAVFSGSEGKSAHIIVIILLIVLTVLIHSYSDARCTPSNSAAQSARVLYLRCVAVMVTCQCYGNECLA
jgi:hypothetical protein